MHPLKNRLLAWAGLLVGGMALSQNSLADPHVHGEGRLNLVAVEGQLLIELHSPLANLVGFEHSPRTEQERQQLAAARAELESGAAQPQLVGGDCRLASVAVVQQGSEAAHSHDHAEETAQHGDLSLSYQFQCQSVTALRQVQLAGVFEAFPGFAKIRAQWVVEAQQGSAVATPTQPTLELK